VNDDQAATAVGALIDFEVASADMTLEEFKATVSASNPPSVSTALQALWYDAHGDWDRAHEVADSVESEATAWVHAYLHRKEGKPDNASYWYRLAGQPEAVDSLEAEWVRIAAALLAKA
jgi:hypothetical protein